MKQLGFLLAWMGLAGLASAQDSTSVGSISEWSAWSEHQWASNAAPKWAMAGVAFGGDISGPVRTLVSLSEQKEADSSAERRGPGCP